jgi:hypothetical protein
MHGGLFLPIFLPFKMRESSRRGEQTGKLEKPGCKTNI